MEIRGSRSDKPLALKLANGKEKTFRDGAEMYAWYMKNRDSHQSRKKKRPNSGSNKKQ
jgi:hypothetical protein